ncbi:flagellar motor switch protein FliG [Sodalis praecaptivus]|uniref:flagellar motor switch protein FliG n=1 Tax=Sodalis praecaptivus TaxID=1239307 RepID=UPI0027F130C7|nr:flagellar motor switch protein FliG [Sodalis praecaptivus]CAJ0999850.1 Flagellar motor switch protein FliG [Sodalis praecaptivus]
MNAIEKSAIVMLTLGEETAAAVFKHLRKQEVEAIGKTIASLGIYSRQQLTSVLEAFHADAETMISPDKDSYDYLRAALISALGEDRALLLLEELHITGADDDKGIDALNAMKPQAVAALIQAEHPQVIAAILVLLKRSLAAEILSGFEETLRNDILVRIATLDGLQPAALQELTLALNDLLRGQRGRQGNKGGVRPAAEILTYMQSRQEEAAIDAVRALDQNLAERIVKHLFTFDDLQDLDDRSLRRILQEIDADTLVIALKGCAPSLVDRILGNMSQRQAEILRDDLSLSAPVKESRVETERKAILAVVRRLADADEIVINKDGENYV